MFIATTALFLLSRFLVSITGYVLPTDPEVFLYDTLTGILLYFLAFGVLAPALAYAKLIERTWEKVLRTQNRKYDFPKKSPLRSDVIQYASLETDRESFYNQLSLTIGFCFLGISLFIPVPLPLLLYWGIAGASIFGIVTFSITSFHKWSIIAGRLMSVRFLAFVHHYDQKKTQLEAMSIAENNRDWGRLLDLEKEILRHSHRNIDSWSKSLPNAVKDCLKKPLMNWLGTVRNADLWIGYHLDDYFEEFKIIKDTSIGYYESVIKEKEKSIKTENGLDYQISKKNCEEVGGLSDTLKTLLEKIVQRQNQLEKIHTF
ncbi:MAG: hypothetical protein ACFE9D_11050 [Promethearchaeota archaeon]